MCVCIDVLVSQFTEGLKSPQILTRCGSALALGCLPRFMLESKLKQVCVKYAYIFHPLVEGVDVFVSVLDPRRPSADVLRQSEGGEFHRGSARCSQSDRSVSIISPCSCFFCPFRSITQRSHCLVSWPCTSSAKLWRLK